MAAPYVCPAGYWTVGYGILCQASQPEITLQEGEEALSRALPVYLSHALRLSPRLASESEGRLVALSDFIFNLGPTRYASSTLRRRVNEGAWEAAGRELRRWVWGGGRKLPGLILRRETEAVLLNV